MDRDAATSRPTFLIADTAPSESVAVTVMMNVPVSVGVPEISPVDVLSVKPAGSEPDPAAIAHAV